MKKRIWIVALILLLTLCCVVACVQKEPTAKSLQITAYPKLNYFLGEELDLSQGKFKVKFSDGSLGEEILMTAQGVAAQNYNKNQLGEQAVELTYQGLSTAITVTVEQITEQMRQERLRDQLLEGVKNLAPSAIASNGSAIEASFALLKNLSENDDAFEDILQLALAADPNYINTLCEYYFGKEGFDLLLDFVGGEIAALFAEVEGKIASLNGFIAGDNSEMFILNYIRFGDYLDNLAQSQYAFVGGYILQLTQPVDAIYESYHFDLLTSSEFFAVYLLYLQAAEGNGAGYTQSGTFKTKMEAVLTAYYNVDVKLQIAISQNCLLFDSFFAAYFNQYVFPVNNAVTEAVMNGRTALNSALASRTDNNGNDTFVEFCNAIDNAIYTLEYTKYNTDEEIHPFVERELRSIKSSYVYKVKEIKDLLASLDSEYSFWDSVFREMYEEYGWYPPNDVVRFFALVELKTDRFMAEHTDSAAIELYNLFAKAERERLEPLAVGYYQHFAQIVGGDTIKICAEVYYLHQQATTNLYNWGGAAHLEFWQEFAPIAKQAIEAFWQLMLTNDDNGVPLGASYYSLTNTLDILGWYLDYYAFYDHPELLELYGEFRSIMFFPNDSSDRFSISFLKDTYFFLCAYQTLSQEKQAIFNLGLNGGGFSGLMQQLFDNNNTYDLWLFEVGYEFSQLNYVVMSCRYGDWAAFIVAYHSMQEALSIYTEEQIALVNEVWNNDGTPSLLSFQATYDSVMYPYISGNDQGITDTEINQLVDAFYQLVEYRKYLDMADEVLSALGIGASVPSQNLDELSTAAEEFAAILHALPFAMQEKLVSQAVGRESLLGNVYKNLMYVYVYAQLGGVLADEYVLGRAVVSIEDNYIGFMAEKERIGSGNQLTNTYYYRFLETFTLQEMAAQYAQLNGMFLSRFDATIIGSLFADYAAQINSINPLPSPLFNQLVEVFREYSLAYENAYISGDMTFFFAAHQRLEQFLADFAENGTEADKIMFDSSLIMLEIFNSVGYYYDYLSNERIWVISGTPAQLYQNLFLDNLHGDLLGTCSWYYVTEEGCGQFLNQYLQLVNLYLADEAAFYSLNESEILNLMSGLREINSQSAQGFLGLFTSYNTLIMEYYYNKLSTAQLHVLDYFLRAESTRIVYNAEYEKWQAMLSDPYQSDYADSQYEYYVYPALQSFMTQAFLAYNLSTMLTSIPAGSIIENLFNLIMPLALENLPQNESLSISLHNIGALLITANQLASQSYWYDFTIVFNLASRAIENLSPADKGKFETIVYLVADEEMTLEDMYEQIAQVASGEIVPEYYGEAATTLFNTYKTIAWEYWLGEFSDCANPFEGMDVVLKSLHDYAISLEYYEMNNFVDSYCGGFELVYTLFDYAEANLQSNSEAFAAAILMLEGFGYLLDWQSTQFSYLMEFCTEIYSGLSSAEKTAFDNLFGDLFTLLTHHYNAINGSI